MNEFKWRNPTPQYVECYSFNDYLDKSLEKFANIYSKEIKNNVEFFMNYQSDKTIISLEEFIKNPQATSRVGLYKSDFSTFNYFI